MAAGGQADINKSADDYEEILRQSRARAEAYSRELAEWEAQTARARNEGTFFKGLFKADVLQRPGGQPGSSPPEPSSSQVSLCVMGAKMLIGCCTQWSQSCCCEMIILFPAHAWLVVFQSDDKVARQVYWI
jgi:hypothetical protein